MMNSNDIQHYQDQLIEYLESTRYYRNADDSKMQKLVDAIEIDLLGVLKTELHVEIEVVYEFLDKEVLRNLINETNHGRSLYAQNVQSQGLLRNAINFYLAYLESQKHPLSEQEQKGRKKLPQESSTTSAAVPKNNEELKGKPGIPEPKEYDKLEGAKHEETVTRYERDRGNRKDCIAHYGYVCQVCEMDFEKTYGVLGKDFIEVHHLHPVAQGERPVNPIIDLIPLCSNCHSMIHRMDDVSDWRGLRELYLSHKQIESNNGEESN